MTASRLRAALLVAGAFLLSAIPAVAQMPELPLGKWWKRPRVVEFLKLSPDQQERLEDVFSKNRRTFVDLKADVERRMIDVEELMSRKDSDAKKVAAAVDGLEQARGRLGRAHTMMIVEMRGILTNEQWQRILDRRDEWRGERDGERRMRRRLLDGPGKDGPVRDGAARKPGAAPPADPDDKP